MDSLPEKADGPAAATPRLKADHIGSLLRPAALREARLRAIEGILDAAGLRAAEDAAIRDGVRRQEEAGLHAISDGDFRREHFHIDFLNRLQGIAWDPKRFRQGFQGGPGEGLSPAVFVTHGKISHTADICVEDYRFLAGCTARFTDLVAKVTMPSPSFAHCRGGRAAIDAAIYPDLEPFFADLAAAYAAEIAALGAAGCRYVQLDEVHYTFFCDPQIAAGLRARGDAPEQLAVTYAKLINDSIAARPPGMLAGVHLCRGNKQSSWVAQGGYEPVAEVLFNAIAADRFLLEYDSDRAGDFAPLRFVPKGPTVVLGLVTTKSPAMESADVLKRRIEEAARFVPIEQLALSPQCGFASSIEGNKIDEDSQWRKLELIARFAEQVWGSAA